MHRWCLHVRFLLLSSCHMHRSPDLLPRCRQCRLPVLHPHHCQCRRVPLFGLDLLNASTLTSICQRRRKRAAAVRADKEQSISTPMGQREARCVSGGALWRECRTKPGSAPSARSHSRFDAPTPDHHPTFPTLSGRVCGDMVSRSVTASQFGSVAACSALVTRHCSVVVQWYSEEHGSQVHRQR